MSYKDEDKESGLEKKFEKYKVRLSTRIDGTQMQCYVHGVVKDKFYQELKRTGITESKLLLSMVKYYFDEKGNK